MFLKYDKIFYKRQKEKAVTCNRCYSGRIKYNMIYQLPTSFKYAGEENKLVKKKFF